MQHIRCTNCTIGWQRMLTSHREAHRFGRSLPCYLINSLSSSRPSENHLLFQQETISRKEECLSRREPIGFLFLYRQNTMSVAKVGTVHPAAKVQPNQDDKNRGTVWKQYQGGMAKLTNRVFQNIRVQNFLVELGSSQ